MAKMLPRRQTEESVLRATIRRIHHLYDRFDRVVVSFSGGKDSTVCLQLTLQVARERGKLPVEVYCFDEEAIHPETVEYLARVAALPDVKFHWFCVPVTHRNACSRREPYWRPWNQDDREKWVRALPASAITHFPGFVPGMTVPAAALSIYGPEAGTVAHIRGIRAQESLRRLMSVSSKRNDNWIAGPMRSWYVEKEDGWQVGKGGSVNFMTSPIYDWTLPDVWVAPRMYGWDYNHTYDVFEAAGLPAHMQRVCPPFGEEPLANLCMYAECWPDLWHRMIQRVPGAATAARYCRTELFGYGKTICPRGYTWKDWTFKQLDLYQDKHRRIIADNVAKIIAMHKKKTTRQIPMETADPLTGLSWRFLAILVNRGDLKGRRRQKLNDNGIQQQRRMGITMQELLDMEPDGGTRY